MTLIETVLIGIAVALCVVLISFTFWNKDSHPAESLLPTDHAPDVAEVLANWDHIVKTSARLSERNSRVNKILVLGLAFDVVLTLGLGYAYARLNDQNIARCEANNAFRHDDLAKWQYIVKQYGGSQATAQQAKAFVKYVKKVDAPVKC